jgi:hypothetical protein
MTVPLARVPDQAPDLCEIITRLPANATSVILGIDERGEYVQSTLAQLTPLRLVDVGGEGRDPLAFSLLAQIFLRNDPDALRVLMIDPRKRLSRLFHAFPQTRLVATSPTAAVHALYTLDQELIRRQQSDQIAPAWLVFVEEDRSLRQDEQTWQLFTKLIDQGGEVGLCVIVASSVNGCPVLEDEPQPAFRSTAAFPLTREEAESVGLHSEVLLDLTLDKIFDHELPARFVLLEGRDGHQTGRKVTVPFVDTRLLFLLASGWGEA